MSRYHFNVYDGYSDIDEDGHELPDLHAARVEALRLAGGIIKDAADRADMSDEWRVEVTDDSGLMLFRMEFTVVESQTAKTASMSG